MSCMPLLLFLSTLHSGAPSINAVRISMQQNSEKSVRKVAAKIMISMFPKWSSEQTKFVLL